jgi:hypothetical protein
LLDEAASGRILVDRHEQVLDEYDCSGISREIASGRAAAVTEEPSFEVRVGLIESPGLAQEESILEPRTPNRDLADRESQAEITKIKSTTESNSTRPATGATTSTKKSHKASRGLSLPAASIERRVSVVAQLPNVERERTPPSCLNEVGRCEAGIIEVTTR